MTYNDEIKKGFLKSLDAYIKNDPTATKKRFADTIGVHPDTLRKWKKKFMNESVAEDTIVMDTEAIKMFNDIAKMNDEVTVAAKRTRQPKDTVAKRSRIIRGRFVVTMTDCAGRITYLNHWGLQRYFKDIDRAIVVTKLSTAESYVERAQKMYSGPENDKEFGIECLAMV